jgi:hypothetical protein
MEEARALYDTSHLTFQRARRSVFAFAVLAVASVAACGGGDSGTTGPAATVVGTYSISTINGKTLPVALFPSDPLFTFEVTVGSLALTADGKYFVSTTTKQTITGNVQTFVDTTSGTWVLTGTAVAFTNAHDGLTDNATWDKNQLTFAEASGKFTPLSVKFGPKPFASLSQAQVAARLSAPDPLTYVYKK